MDSIQSIATFFASTTSNGIVESFHPVSCMKSIYFKSIYFKLVDFTICNYLCFGTLN